MICAHTRHDFAPLRDSTLYRAMVRGTEVVRPYFLMLRFTAHFICISCRGFDSNSGLEMHVKLSVLRPTEFQLQGASRHEADER